jgi:hypothetical protein
MEAETADVAPLELSKRIFVVRGQRVLLDSDLAELYGVKTLRLNEQVRRNADRFPDDFLLRLTNQEVASLGSHFAILKTGRGQHRKYPPLAFTEHTEVLGGQANRAAGVLSTVAGGRSNTASGNTATVSGGERDTASGGTASFSGGSVNTASGAFSNVVAGRGNTAAGIGSSVLGGNTITVTAADTAR